MSDDEFDAKIRDLLAQNDKAAAQVCENYKTLGVAGYMVRTIDPSIEDDSDDVKVIGPIGPGSGDVYRRGASLCERYLRLKAGAH